jgi:hypothetical protein
VAAKAVNSLDRKAPEKCDFTWHSLEFLLDFTDIFKAEGCPMSQFKIRKKFLFALGLINLLLLVLLLVCIAQHQATGKIVILAAIMLPVLGLFIESWRRQIKVNEDSVVACRLFRTKKIPFGDITSVDTVKIRRRVFVSISTDLDFLLFSNNYDNFDQLIKLLQDRLPQAVISEETKNLSQNLPLKSNDLFSIWLAVVVLVLILYMQLGGTF